MAIERVARTVVARRDTRDDIPVRACGARHDVVGMVARSASADAGAV
jgi:hypothetical protein